MAKNFQQHLYVKFGMLKICFNSFDQVWAIDEGYKSQLRNIFTFHETWRKYLKPFNIHMDVHLQSVLL